MNNQVINSSCTLQIAIKNLYCYTCSQFYDEETFKLHHIHTKNSDSQDNNDADADVKIESITDQEQSDYENKVSIKNDCDDVSSAPAPKQHQRSRVERKTVVKPLKLSMYRDYLHCCKCYDTFYNFPQLTAHFHSCKILPSTNFTFTDFVWRRSEKISKSTLTSSDELDNYENQNEIDNDNDNNNSFGTIIMGNSLRWKSANEIENKIENGIPNLDLVLKQQEEEQEREPRELILINSASPSSSDIQENYYDDPLISSSENNSDDNNDNDEIFEPPSPASSHQSSSSSCSVVSISSNDSETIKKKKSTKNKKSTKIKKTPTPRKRRPQQQQQQQQTPEGEETQETTVKKPVEKTFLCTYCPKIYATRPKLQYHINSHEGIKPFKCTYEDCDRSFHGRKNLYRHLAVHKKNLAKDKDKDKVKSKLNQEKNPSLIDAKKIYHCTEESCGKVFKNSKGLRQHQESHLPKTILCPVPECGRFFSTQKRIDIHQSAFHLKNRKHMCEICGASFYQHFSMVLHKRCHQQIKNFVCHICAKAFTQSTLLKRHLWVHSGTKNYECREGCDRKFRTSGQRKRHEQTHTKFHPYKCAFCDDRFLDNRQLKKHVNQHMGEYDFDLNIPSTYQGQI